ncbi:3-phenylpropionate/trans-cinnamate dioxygenase ferredoxin reductase subunit [Streptomyces sp. 3212.3]|uniref:NAD(P)/FAD-dependent oxidoreductase n=1 Tax=Streptomyces sp. 3212.3 TaxID=1938846 RepID=UPI000E268C23|nr:FAD-dependent oxidoreductase [Streptomyces sp. 3212.3]REE57866.1 3-phenylpropionate/trans-cinnamate dioxygenase ferredoxin reductase subunit [Streptomyces sp. 3212.3]
MSGGTLIVGASQAGLQLAASLRQLGDTEPITLVGEEIHPPYQRPPLSKEFLTGQTDLESLALRTPSYYTDAGINLVPGERVTEVDLSPSGRPGSGTARTPSGRVFSFDRLALTVGAGPRRLAVPGADLDGIRYLRDRDDAAHLRQRLTTAPRVVVVGGGFIGLEAAAVARGFGKDVTVVEAADRLISRAVAPVVSEFYRGAHVRRGTRVLLSAAVAGFDGERGRVTGVRLADGTRLPADLVLIGVGVLPRTELAERLGLECDRGIVVDGGARTSDPHVVAAGDCTVQPHPMTGLGRVRLESVQNAVAQAATAAATLLGTPAPQRAVPWFWSYQGDLKLQIAGLSGGYDQHVVRGDPDSERFSVLYYRQDELLAIDAVNSPADYMAVRKALTQGTTIAASVAGDSGTPLKALLTTGPAVVPSS